MFHSMKISNSYKFQTNDFLEFHFNFFVCFNFFCICSAHSRWYETILVKPLRKRNIYWVSAATLKRENNLGESNKGLDEANSMR